MLLGVFNDKGTLTTQEQIDNPGLDSGIYRVSYASHRGTLIMFSAYYHVQIYISAAQTTAVIRFYNYDTSTWSAEI